MIKKLANDKLLTLQSSDSVDFSKFQLEITNMINRITSQVLLSLLITILSVFSCYADLPESCLGDCPVENLCGNQQVDPGEECDSTEGCNYNCQYAVCGNGIVEEGSGEQCDNGETDLNCLDEESNCNFMQNLRIQGGQELVTICNDSCLLQTCGNEIIEGDEQCDFGDTEDGDGCSASCRLEECGNEIIEGDEQCDFGDTEIGDGCSASCRFEECGNSILDPGEQCDEGNPSSNDGCSNTCIIETECVGNNCGPQAEVFDCLDKEGQLNKLDRCQVCGGDGQSCLACVESSNVEDQLRMDGASKRMAGLIIGLNKKLLKLEISNQLKRNLLNSNNQVKELYLTSWTLAWSLPLVTKACNTVFCTTADLSPLVVLYAEKLAEIEAEARKSARILKRLTGNKNSAKQFLEKITEQYNSGIETSGLVTTSTSVCS